MPRTQVIGVMQALTAGLGVGCEHCHVRILAPSPTLPLKSKFYGAPACDFSSPLATAQPLVQNRTGEALQFLQMNLETLPPGGKGPLGAAYAE